MKICQNCGAQMSDDAMFCGECGTKVVQASAPVEHIVSQQPKTQPQATQQVQPMQQPYQQQGYAQQPMQQPYQQQGYAQQPMQQPYQQQGYAQQPMQQPYQQQGYAQQQPVQQPYQQQGYAQQQPVQQPYQHQGSAQQQPYQQQGYSQQPIQNHYQQQGAQVGYGGYVQPTPVINQEKVPFEKAVMDAVKNHYCDFKGRASRSEFWWTYLAYMGSTTILMILSNILYSDYTFFLYMLSWILRIIAILISLGGMLPMLGVGVRRLHDTGRSGLLMLLTLIPFVQFILLYWWAQESEPRPNQYGPVPNLIQ